MNRSVLKLAVPSILANITVPLVGMVDLAIAGRLGDASVIGAVAIATMLFDLLYWNMAFLRLGTGGLIAQAFGKGDNKEISRVFVQGISTAALLALFVLAIQYLFVKAAFLFIECTPQVQNLATEYFFIRIWAAPATISLYVFKGFYIGMQNTVIPMAVELTINVTNILASVYFALYTPMGFAGIAAGTVVAQYSGMALSIVFLFSRYRYLFADVKILACIKLGEMKSFFVLNADLLVRSLCFLFVYVGFTSLSAKYGDVALAVCSIMMKLMMLFSYFVDGFAYAAEALTGRFIGAKDATSLHRAIKIIFVWSGIIGVVSTFVYLIAADDMILLMTKDANVIEASGEYIGWMLVMPIISCLAFTWDGVYIGATASKAIRNSMLWAVVGFFAVYYALSHSLGLHALWGAYIIHLLARSAYLTVRAKKDVFSRVG
ncbi:MAG: MATE family efflux transporter [Bacteroidales bacterium]|nr:MATE family efflux transporter [Bacteroidales bacterium]